MNKVEHRLNIFYTEKTFFANLHGNIVKSSSKVIVICRESKDYG